VYGADCGARAIAKRKGIGCIVDAGAPDMGRDIGSLRQIAQKSGMPIVASGGFQVHPKNRTC
jgi:predicted metal-dependent phosphotriesterase family hydrolase